MIPRPEYPRPQMVRKNWINLNGEWEFEIDNSKSGIAREFYLRQHLNQKITVPFCPESALSGIGNTDFMYCVWYRRSIEIPEQWQGKRILLHFGAVDYLAILYVNGREVCRHKGGYTPFYADITDYLQESGNTITLCAQDDTPKCGDQPRGKQCWTYHSYGCLYTRTTGIWQTVWMECVDPAAVRQVQYTPDAENGRVFIEAEVTEAAVGGELIVKTFFEGKPMGEAKAEIGSLSPKVTLSLAERHLWEPGQGRLYDTEIEIKRDGAITDQIQGYFGLRSIILKQDGFYLNGVSVFGRYVLDQGYYPDGIYTAPTDEALKKDILCSMELGFNGARLHEKIFEPRYLYWADRLGYLVWGEHANWGLCIKEAGQVMHFLPEWMEALKRDYSHPSIIGWCPFNETWDEEGNRQCDDVLRLVYQATKAFDPTRPVIDTSGNFHVITDLYDVHDYDQNPQSFREHYQNADKGEISESISRNPLYQGRQTYPGGLLFMSEYGGIKKGGKEGDWGYGEAPKDDEAFLERYRGLTSALLENKMFMGFCYTQLYDVEQEVNGLMTYDRQFKFDPKLIYDINQQPAAIEQK